MRVFLQVCKELLGDSLQDVILMTDDTEVYVNASTAVIGTPAYRLLCTWHIDRAWRKNLLKIKGDAVIKATVYKTVRALLELTCTEQFAVKLHQLMAAAKEDPKTADFACYFEREYASPPKVWAYCHRFGLKVHHNMHLEVMHRVIKHVHLQGRKVRRLDKSIHALMRFLHTKMSDRLHRSPILQKVCCTMHKAKKPCATTKLNTTCLRITGSVAARMLRRSAR